MKGCIPLMLNCLDLKSKCGADSADVLALYPLDYSCFPSIVQSPKQAGRSRMLVNNSHKISWRV